MFKEIKTKNVFVNEDKTKLNKHGVSVFVLDGDYEVNIAKTWDEDYAQFIAFCFNLQQKYDIGLFEQAVYLLEKLVEENMCSCIGDELIEGLLEQIKK